MKKHIRQLALLLTIIPLALRAHDGLLHLHAVQGDPPGGKTYALVIGISNYQDAVIPDLRYAHRDADAYADYLASPVGGALEADQLQLLTNNNATQANVAIALDRIQELAREGDRVIFYFSGYCDSETKGVTKPGHLLLYNTPSRVYASGGTLSVGYVNEWVTNLCLKNRARVMLYLDVCHPAKLSGSAIGGMEYTAAILAKPVSSDIRILSCQPGSYSLEGPQWGGGRSCFSHFLVEGLSGMADGNKDQTITVRELETYLKDKLKQETAPNNQIPVIAGDAGTELAAYSPALLAEFQKNKSQPEKQMGQLHDLNALESNVLQRADSNARVTYREFKLALREKRYLEPKNRCADYYYRKLMQNESLRSLHNGLTMQFAASLQEDPNNAVIGLISRSYEVISATNSDRAREYAPFVGYLNRAIELLGAKNPFNAKLHARKYFFEGMMTLLVHPDQPDQEVAKKTLASFHNALSFQPDAPLICIKMAQTFASLLKDRDSTLFYANKAMELAPNWTYPYALLPTLLEDYFSDAETGMHYFEKAFELDSTQVSVWYYFGLWNRYQGNYPAAANAYKRAQQLHGQRTIFFSYWIAQDYANIPDLAPYEAELAKLAKGSLDWQMEVVNLATGYAYKKNYDKAISYFEMLAAENKAGGPDYYNLACNYALSGKQSEALRNIENALEKGWRNYRWMQEDTDLVTIRPLPKWKALMKKYFPEQERP